MKNIVPVLLSAALVGTLTVGGAQTKTSRVGYVYTQQMLKAHPKGAGAFDIASKRDKELKDIQTKIEAVSKKISAGTATAAEKEQYQVLAQTYNSTAKRYQDQYDKAIQPITADIDAAVKTAAVKAGFGLVLSAEVGQATGLIIYGDKDSDLTDEVVASLKK
ncbi:MAG TPA: OmpH family outer membrane protein [Deinococcales bacterium]|nr:OmpH family outer membrane protein [Deinococcales bacterium]